MKKKLQRFRSVLCSQMHWAAEQGRPLQVVTSMLHNKCSVSLDWTYQLHIFFFLHCGAQQLITITSKQSVSVCTPFKMYLLFAFPYMQMPVHVKRPHLAPLLSASQPRQLSMLWENSNCVLVCACSLLYWCNYTEKKGWLLLCSVSWIPRTGTPL